MTKDEEIAQLKKVADDTMIGLDEFVESVREMIINNVNYAHPHLSAEELTREAFAMVLWSNYGMLQEDIMWPSASQQLLAAAMVKLAQQQAS